MSKSLTTIEVIINTLSTRSGQRLTANELSRAMIEDHEEWAQKKKEKSQNDTIRLGGFEELRAQVQSEIGSYRQRIERDPNLRMTEDRPRKYYYTTLSESEEVEAAEGVSHVQTENSYTEHDLYPILADYLNERLRVFAKRIDEKKSRNQNGSGGNRWLYPDLIGLEVLSETWSSTIKQLVQARSDRSSRLWSFEVKKLVNRSNVREVYFQALSNSAWANFAYLVAAEISGKGTMDELRMLSSQHGVGVIQLSMSPEEESSITIQAREKSDVDWSAADRLSVENKDAEGVFRQVRVYHQAGELNREFWKG